MIHLTRWWNPAVEDQATDRVFRIGQKRDVHVYLPMAVHPDPLIRETSFDLKLNALIERKRALTRDLFLPPEPGDQDLADLFRDVSSQPAKDDQDVSGEESGASAADISASEPAPRPILSLPEGRPVRAIRDWRLPAGAPRPDGEVVSLFAGCEIERLVIRDPYALGHPNARAAQVKFIGALSAAARSLAAIDLEYAPEATGDADEGSVRRDFGSRMSAAFPDGPPRFSLVRRSRRSRDDDFHDRSVEIYVRGAGGAVSQHTLMIGRGVSRPHPL